GSVSVLDVSRVGGYRRVPRGLVVVAGAKDADGLESLRGGRHGESLHLCEVLAGAGRFGVGLALRGSRSAGRHRAGFDLASMAASLGHVCADRFDGGSGGDVLCDGSIPISAGSALDSVRSRRGVGSMVFDTWPRPSIERRGESGAHGWGGAIQFHTVMIMSKEKDIQDSFKKQKIQS
ncbi:hypothetical protein IIC38_19905, partial [candidate division KSB1 bacterium]|nr:hypothetical protein [candidate division KSB1 bacterium]